ncbi:MAG: glycine cleavage system protein GcvH [Desulfurococcales archaeon]|jgi:glycine cleavage system H protein|uniref:Probable glycine cleavage system H protein n=1 Tax=Fervidicoccus fontis TaxID=683846 RepID=A0A7J3SKC9_9CREN|nr:glycine cleavage system protein GcvH [Desulfurococcales archaeon]
MSLITVKNYTVRSDLLYTETDEWVKIEGDVATIGITDYAQKQLRDVVGVDFVEKGKKVKKGDAVATLDSVKAASDVYTPLSGEVIEVNETLLEAPQLINNDPYENGWIIKIKVEDKEEIRELLTPQKYAELISSRVEKK